MEENVSNAPSARSTGLKFGLVSAVVSIVFFLVLTLIGQNAFDNKWGWISMIFSLVILILAHKEFKDQGNGFMTYGQGVGIGFWISLVAVAIGCIFTYSYVAFVDPALMETFFEKQMEEMGRKGMPEEQIEMAIKWTKMLFWPMYVFFGVFFGVLVALIVSIFTQKKNPETTF